MAATLDNPYGVTIYYNGPGTTTYLHWTQLLADVQALGLGWLRFQQDWSAIENPQGTYAWTTLDDAVSRCNAAGINLCFTLQNAPSWALQNIAQRCTTEPYYLPDPTLLAGYAGAVAARYNSLNGHGFMAAIEVNEDFDVHYASATYGGTTSYQPCRDPAYFTPCLQTYSASIRAASPHTKVGMCALLWRSLPHSSWFLAGLYTSGLQNAFDYINLHFYNGTNDPTSSQDAGSGTNAPSFSDWWQALQQVATANGDPHKEIWVTEFGWATNTNPGRDASTVLAGANALQIQASYYQSVLDSARTSGCVKKMFLYTIAYNNDGMSLVQGSIPMLSYLPAFSMLQNYIAQHPTFVTPAQNQARRDSIQSIWFDAIRTWKEVQFPQHTQWQEISTATSPDQARWTE